MRNEIILSFFLLCGVVLADEQAHGTNAIGVVVSTLQDAQRASNAVAVSSEEFGTAVITSRNVIAGADKVEVYFNKANKPIIVDSIQADYPSHDLVVLEVDLPEEIVPLALGDCLPGTEFAVFYAQSLSLFSEIKGYVSGTMLAGNLPEEDRRYLFGSTGDELIDAEGRGVAVAIMETEPAVNQKDVNGVLSCAPVIDSEGKLLSMVWKDSCIGLKGATAGKLGGIVSSDLKSLMAKPLIAKKIKELEPTGFLDVDVDSSKMLLEQLDIARELTFEEGDLDEILSRIERWIYEKGDQIAKGLFKDSTRELLIEMDPNAGEPRPSQREDAVFSICDYLPGKFRAERQGWLVIRKVNSSAVKAISYYDSEGAPDGTQVLFQHGRPQLVILYQGGRPSSFVHYIDAVVVQRGKFDEIEGRAKDCYEELKKTLKRIKRNEGLARTMVSKVEGMPLQFELGERNKRAIKINIWKDAQGRKARMEQHYGSGTAPLMGGILGR